MSGARRVAWFVSPHGFGHAARSAAIAEAVVGLRPGTRIDFWTSVPRWFFEESLGAPFGWRELACDVGLVQRSPVEEDLAATVAALGRLWGGSFASGGFGVFRGEEKKAQTRKRSGTNGVAESLARVADSAGTVVERLLAGEALGRKARTRKVGFVPPFEDVARGADGPVGDAGDPHAVSLDSGRIAVGDGVFGEKVAREVAAALLADGVDLVVADIAPLGLAAAATAGIPSVLVENFTWDWIYEPLAALEPGLVPWVPFLRERFALADLRLQLEPACAPNGSAAGVAGGAAAVAAVVSVPPVARAPRSDRAAVRRRLAVPEGCALVLVSLGGIEHRLGALEALASRADAVFVVPGGSDREESRGTLRLLPHHSPIHHPDLVAAADVVVGKLGYSTVAEAVGAGTRFLYAPRPGFRESAVLERFVHERLPAAEISWAELSSGEFAARIPSLLVRPVSPRRPADGGGARVAAETIAGRFL